MYLNIILTSKGNAVLQCCFHKMKKTRFLKIDAKNNSNAVFISEIYVLFATAVYAWYLIIINYSELVKLQGNFKGIRVQSVSNLCSNILDGDCCDIKIAAVNY